MKYLRSILFILFLVIPFVVSAQQTGNGLNLLEIAPGASELSRGETRIAVPNGANSIYSNPALLSLEQRSTIDLSYTNWLADFNNVFGGINLKKGNRALAFAFYTSGEDGFEQRDRPGESNGNFSIQYLSIAGAYSHDFNWFTLGISGQYLNEDVYLYRANGYAINLGATSSLLNDRLTLGASVTNLGEMEELNTIATQLPTSFNAGFSVDLMEFTHYKKQDLPILVTLMADFVAPLNDENPDRFTDYNPDKSYMNFGISLEIAEVVIINSGFKTGTDTRPLSFGAGILTDKVIFNYALIPFNTGFGTVHSVGIQYQL